MKKRIVLLAAVMSLILTGCGGVSRAGEQDGETLDAALVEEAPRSLTQTEVLSAYDRAVTAYGWFDLSPLPCGQEEEIVDGWTYQKVDYPGIEDLADLRAYLRVVFSQELTDRLLTRGERPVYQDLDGALYAAAGTGREKESDKGSVTVEVRQESETVYSVEVTVELLDITRSTVIGVESYSFPYEFQDGSWVFTDFQLVY